MTECPELVSLEAASPSVAVQAHVEACTSCRLVVDLFEQARGAPDAERDCSRFDALLAARGDGTLGRAGMNLLERHLAGCKACRDVAETLSPIADARGDHTTFPNVDPGAYALGLEVGRGGMGRILAARDLRVGRPVAVKELLGHSPRLAARFEREARVTARLQHPGIVPIYEIGQWPDGTPFYSMRMYEGRTLRDAIDKAGSLAARISLLPSVIAATEAVAFAHGQRIIHRDLTPSNVMVGAYGETVVIDWGLAKDLADAASRDDVEAGPYRASDSSGGLTIDGAVIGTVAYMPPEQANAVPVDERADVYALGAILYHLLAGASPYKTSSGGDAMSALKAGPPRSVELIEPAAPRDLVSIVAKAMAREPNARYPSARELADELKRFQTGRIVEAHEYTTVERVRRFAARNRAPLIVTVVAVALLSLLGAVAVRRVLRERKAAQMTVLTLLEEEGRVELLAGNSLRALAYLDAAVARTPTPLRGLRFMRAVALRHLSVIEGDLDCGNYVHDFEFGPGGTTLTATCTDHAQLWRVADRSLIAVLGPFEGGFAHLAYSHDGKTLVTWGADGNARLWDATNGALLRTLPHAKDVTITFATFTPDDTLISTSGHDGWAKIWNANTGELVRTIRGSTAPILHYLYGLFSHDGKHLLTLTIEGMGTAWDVATGAKLGGFQHGSIAVGGELWAHGPLAVTCGMNRLVKVWNTDTGQLVVQLAAATNVVWSCRFSDDGKFVLGTSHDHHAYVWDVATGAAITSVNHGSPAWTGHFSADAKRFLTVSLVGGSVKVWDTRTGDLLTSHDTQGGEQAKFSPDGTRLVAGLGDGRIRIWRGSSGPLRATYRTASHAALLAVTSDGARVAVQMPDGSLELRDSASGQRLGVAPLRAPVGAARSRFVAATAETDLVVLDANDGAVLATLPIGASSNKVAITDDGLRVIVELGDRDVEIWSVERRTRIAVLAGTRHAVPSEDGRRAVGWSPGEAPRVWDVDAQQPVTTLRVTAPYEPIGFVVGGQRAVVEQGTGGSRSIAILDVQTGTAVATVTGQVAKPTIDPSGRRLTVIFANGRVETWDLVGTLETPTTAFTADKLQDGQIDPSGDLVAAIDGLGETVLVMSAHDGRVLARWRMAHDPPIVSQDGFDSPRAIARWSPDGNTIVTTSNPDPAQSLKAALLGGATSGHLAVWNTEPDFYDARGTKLSEHELAALVRRNVPWQVSGGRLVAALATLTGRVVRNGAPIAGAKFKLQFREPPKLEGEIVRGRVTITNKALAPLEVDAQGYFSRKLPPGSYTLVVEAQDGSRNVLDIDLRVGDGPRVLDLERSHRGSEP